LRLVPAENVHVVADGCTDATASVAAARGVNVLELTPGRGKAGGIEAAVSHFDLAGRYAVLIIADADTRLDEHYLRRGLPILDQPGVVALAGYARAGWRPRELSLIGRFLAAYRTRLYALSCDRPGNCPQTREKPARPKRLSPARSEERRVGKECRARWARTREQKQRE